MITERVVYQHLDQTFFGHMAILAEKNQLQEPLPVVMVAHAWGGRDDFACQKAEELAQMGYVGFALDLYGHGKLGGSKEENSALMTPLVEDRELLRARLKAGMQICKNIPQANPQKMAIIGYCFGGLCALELARSGAEILGAVSIHGLLHTSQVKIPAPQIKSKVLALHGYEDPMVDPSMMLSFMQEMTAAQSDWQLHAYGQTMHAFTNPSANDPDFGTVYSKKADQRATQSIRQFLQEIFQ